MAIKVLFQNEHCDWIDVQAPTKEDLAFLHQKYNINTLLLEDTLDPNHLPKFEQDEEVLFFLTRENINSGKTGINNISNISTKLGMFLTGNMILTVHRMKTISITACVSELKSVKESVTRDKIALRLALKIIETYDNESKKIADTLEDMENDLFLKNKNNSEQIRRLYRLKRKSFLNSKLLTISTEWVKNFHRLELSDAEVTDLLDKHKDVVADFDHLSTQTTSLISTFLALSDQKANQVMKLLAMYSVYFLPITFIAGVYGMNFEHMPELSQPYAYYFTLAFMLGIVVFTYIYFRTKKW